jgi:hypothetical protein
VKDINFHRKQFQNGTKTARQENRQQPVFL